MKKLRHRESRDLPNVTQLVSFKDRGQIVFFFLLNLSLPTGGGSDGKESAGDALQILLSLHSLPSHEGPAMPSPD